jgi:hypothetical protein
MPRGTRSFQRWTRTNCQVVDSAGIVKTIDANGAVEDTPTWAVLERRLIDTMNDAVDPVLDRYVEEDGSVMWPPEDDYTGIGGLDNAYEGFWNWPLFYLLGGDERICDLAQDEFDAITEQFAEYDTGFGHAIVEDEYEQGYDWFHQSEGYLLFYFLCMADPENERNRERAERFAEFYARDDAPNYDPEHRILRSPFVGSMGPGYRFFSREMPASQYHSHTQSRIPWEYRSWKASYGLPFWDVEGAETVEDLKDPAVAERMGEVIRERCSRGDTAQNLAATTLMTNAYLVTGAERFREWVLEYVDAWIERAEANGGIIPDNVGLSGEVGEYLDGRWYGGWYGWTWPHGWRTLGAAVTGAAENAHLLSSDRSYLSLPRSQMRHLLDQAVERDGTTYVPRKYGDAAELRYERGDSILYDEDGTVFQRNGWYEFTSEGRVFREHPTHLWHRSMQEEDAELLDAFLDGDATTLCDRAPGVRRLENGTYDHEWVEYLRGNFPGFPEAVLSMELDRVAACLEFVREDEQDPESYSEHYLQYRNPIVTEGLVQCTMGAPLAIYNGGLQVGRVRYFDARTERPGLPPGVAALVTGLERDRTVVRLVNLSASPRAVVVQAGGFGEHRFGTVTYENRLYEFTERAFGYDAETTEQARAVTVDDSVLRVELEGCAGTVLDLEMERFVNEPTYRSPWNR